MTRKIQYIKIYLDVDIEGDDLLDSIGNNITAGWYIYQWPFDAANGDPQGPFEQEPEQQE
jgi:hypothetical protein